jgi:hypothetical protein
MDACYDDHPTGNMGINAENGETLFEYAAKNYKQMLSVNPHLSNNGENIMFSADFTTEEDGTVVFILKVIILSTLKTLH